MEELQTRTTERPQDPPQTARNDYNRRQRRDYMELFGIFPLNLGVESAFITE